MKTVTLTFTLLLLTATVTFAQKKKYEYLMPSVTTDVTAGATFSGISPLAKPNNKILAQRNQFGWHFGIARKRKFLKTKADILYGLTFQNIKHSILFRDSFVAYREHGIREYNTFAINMPIDLHYTLPSFKYAYARMGVATSFVVNNQSTQAVNRSHFMDDAGRPFDAPVVKEAYEFREVKGLDVSLRFGGGLQYTDKKLNSYRLGVNYAHGLLKKDMGFRQNYFEMYFSVTLP